MRRLIVNADDFGFTAGATRGIIDAHERGIVTSASLMVRGNAASQAGAYARDHPHLSVGLHVDLGEWYWREGEWHAWYEVVPLDDLDRVRSEIMCQLELFREWVGRSPTHLDSHQHVHRSGPARHIMERAGKELRVPVRHFDPRVRYCGDFYGQNREGEPNHQSITLDHLEQVLAELPPGVTELACHPGYDDTDNTMYRREREMELQVLCDARLRTKLAEHDIKLISFSDVP